MSNPKNMAEVYLPITEWCSTIAEARLAYFAAGGSIYHWPKIHYFNWWSQGLLLERCYSFGKWAYRYSRRGDK